MVTYKLTSTTETRTFPVIINPLAPAVLLSGTMSRLDPSVGPLTDKILEKMKRKTAFFEVVQAEDEEVQAFRVKDFFAAMLPKRTLCFRASDSSNN